MSRVALLTLSVALALPVRPFAARPQEEAGAIVAEAQRRTDATSQRYQGLLRSFDRSGKVSEKGWTYERLGSHGDSKVVIRFTAPAEVKGVALLVANHLDRASDQWMWTPAIERDRRIALQDRSTRFFGTDFTFEDLEERDVDQFDYARQPDETVDGAACWTIQSVPKPGKRSQYTRAILWIRKDNYAYARVDLWARDGGKDTLVRRLTYRNLREVQGIWTSHEVTMADLRRGSRTELVLDHVQYNVPLRETDFTLEAIRR